MTLKAPSNPLSWKKINDVFSFTFIDCYDIIIPSYLPYMSVSGLKCLLLELPHMGDVGRFGHEGVWFPEAA